MSPFYPFRGGGGSLKGDNVTFFYRFSYCTASLTNINTTIITNIPNLLSRILGSQVRLELEYCEEAVQDLVCDIFR